VVEVSDSASQFSRELPVPDAAEPARSRLLVRNPETTRKQAAVSAQKNRSAKWLMVAAVALLPIVALGLYWWQGVQQEQQKQRQFEELVQRADSAYASGNALTTARPLYLQMLNERPDNSHAVNQLQRITDQLVDDIDVNLAAGSFTEVEAQLERLEEIDPSQAARLNAKLAQQRQVLEQQERLQNVQRLIDNNSYGAALTQIAALRQQTPDSTALNRLESLDSADEALQEGQIASARNWLDNAVALQINDSELQDIEARVVSAENFLTRPLSSYEIGYAREQFSRLERAIEAKNSRAIIELTEETSLRRGLFETLFGRYTQILVQVREVEAKLDPKRVTAVLRIEKMVLPNGDVVFPSASYRDSAIMVERKRYSWSAISW